MVMVPASSFRSSGAVYARNSWNAVQRHGATVYQQLRTYLGAHPPLIQGLYYVLLGLWPVLDVDSFMKATGHKVDYWLVQKVGLLLVAIGCTLCLAAYRREKSPEIQLLAVASAVLQAGADLLFVIGGAISLIYLVDAVIQLGILCLWLHAWFVDNVLLQSAGTVASPGAVPANGQTVPSGPAPGANGPVPASSGFVVPGTPRPS
jgi:hypothetical protein